MKTTALAVVVLLCSGCQSVTPDLAGLPAELAVPTDAMDVRREPVSGGQIGVSYSIVQPYPAEAFLARVRKTLPAAEWSALPHDWLDPGSPSSHQDGWSDFVDRTVSQDLWVHQWMAQWQNQPGDIVLYALRYESSLPPGSVYDARPDNSDLRVTALWIPAPTVKQMQALVR